MLRFHAEKFHAAINMIATMRTEIQNWEEGAQIGPKICTKMMAHLNNLDACFVDMGLVVSRKAVSHVRERLQEPTPANDENLRQMLFYLFRAVNDELSTCFLFSLKQDTSKYFDANESLFGPEVEAAFPTAAYDIAETGKCFALERSTASVMHAMRALEPALFAMAKAVGFTPARDEWGGIIEEIEKRVNPSHAQYIQDRDKREFLAPAATQFRHFKDAWRNHAMHAREKYTPEEADVVIRAVKSFMKHLASRLKE